MNKQGKVTIERLADAIEKLIKVLESKPTTDYRQSYELFRQQECQHEYPNPWHGIIPPTCRKCGKSAPTGVTFTMQSN